MRSLPFYKKILFRLILSFSIFIIIPITIITLNNIIRETNAFKQEQQSQAMFFLNLYELEFRDLLYTNKVKQIIDKLESLSEEKTVISTGKIYNAKGRLLADGFNESNGYNIKPDSLGLKILNSNSDFFIKTDKELIAVRQIRIENRLIGAAVIGIANDKIVNKIAIMQQQAIHMSLISILFVIVINYLLSRSIVNPLYSMLEQTQKTVRGDQFSPLKVKRDNEVGIIAQSYNHLMDRLSSSLNNLKLSQERYDLALAGANDGIWDWDMKEEKIYFSGRWFQIIGKDYEKNMCSFLSWKNLIHPGDKDQFEKHLKDHLEDRTPYLSCEYRMLHDSGKYIWVQTRGIAVKDHKNNYTRMAGSQSDITERKRIEQKLKHNAYYDNLTDLANRTLLLERLKYSFSLSKRDPNYTFYILYLDYDGFKKVNDTFGHKIGDYLLRSIAGRLKKCVGPTDTVCRLGGDEFVILLDNINERQSVIKIADRILAESAREFYLGGHSIFVSVSIGICSNKDGIKDPDDLILNSDMAMYNAKKTGKAQYCFFTPGIREILKDRWTLENELHTAIKEGQLELYYQPLYSIPDRKLHGFEALIRWNHPEKGLIMPDRFIPGAEKKGLIVDITTLSLEIICKKLVYWNTEITPENPVKVFLNLSSKDLMENHSILARVGKAVIKTKCNPGWLGLEVTESSFIQNFDMAIKQLSILKEFGVFIEVDDFGSEYSSLNYLLELPVNGVKIDKSFVKTIHKSHMHQNIVKHIIEMSHDMDNYVIAEGIETEEDLKLLQTLKVDYIQGYYFDKPLKEQDALELIKKEVNLCKVKAAPLSSEVNAG